jgi:very-short-patch-repair endonuclease
MRAPEKTFGRARELRRGMSLPEIVLWQALRRGRLAGLRFRRQHPIGPYILDFYCPSARLAVAVDGFAHDAAAQQRHDQSREAWLTRRKVTVLRFRAGDVLEDQRLEAVLVLIERTAAGAPLRLASLATSPAPQGRNRPLRLAPLATSPAQQGRNRPLRLAPLATAPSGSLCSPPPPRSGGGTART